MSDRKKHAKKYYEKHKARIKQKREKHKEHLKEYSKRYSQTPRGKKSNTINSWKQRGVKLYGYTYDELYEYYIDTTNCEVCGKFFVENKCMDHCHDTGCFRFILCKACNNQDNWMKYFQ